MGENSKIEWCDHTFNPWVGCTKVSPACDFCYAEGWAKRTGQAHLWNGERRRTTEAYWRQPKKWNRDAAPAGVRKRVFCASLADVFDNQVPPEWRNDLWELIGATPHLDWLLLTKRPQHILKMLPVMESDRPGYKPWNDRWPWPNVWLGTTVENQTEADRRIPHLLATPAAVRFISAEPLLGAVDLIGTLARWQDTRGRQSAVPLGRQLIDWVIAGGESGPNARPMHPDWARSLRDQCAAAGVAFLFKQWGAWVPLASDNDGFWPTDTETCIRFDPNGHRVDGGWPMQRVGKKAAGRLLGGVEHNGFPDAPAQEGR